MVHSAVDAGVDVSHVKVDAEEGAEVSGRAVYFFLTVFSDFVYTRGTHASWYFM